MNNLFSLSANYQRILDKINDSDEISAETMDELMSVDESFENKIMSYCSIVKIIESQVRAIEEAAEGMLNRALILSKASGRLRANIQKEMAACNKKKIENEYHVVSLYLNAPKINYTDKSLIPDEYMKKTVKEVIKPDARIILQKLKENVAIPGANLVQEQRLSIE